MGGDAVGWNKEKSTLHTAKHPKTETEQKREWENNNLLKVVIESLLHVVRQTSKCQ